MPHPRRDHQIRLSGEELDLLAKVLYLAARQYRREREELSAMLERLRGQAEFGYKPTHLEADVQAQQLRQSEMERRILDLADHLGMGHLIPREG